MLNQCAVDNPTLPVKHCFPTSSRSWRNSKPFSGNAEPSVWDTHGSSGNVFCKSNGVFISTSSARHFWVSIASETHISACDEWKPNTSSIKGASQDRQPEIHSTPMGGDFSKKHAADQQRLQSSDPHFDKFTTSATFPWTKMIQNWGVYMFTISYRSYDVDQRSGDGWFSGWSEVFVFCERNSNARCWSARFEFSAPIRIIHNTQFRRKASLEEQKTLERTVCFVEEWSFAWSTSNSGSLEPMTLSRKLCRTIYNCLGRKIQIKNTVLQIHKMEIHQKKAGLYCHGLNTCGKEVSSRIHELKKIFGQKRKLWTQRRGQESGNKTAWTKNSWRLLVVESQRAVFQRR